MNFKEWQKCLERRLNDYVAERAQVPVVAAGKTSPTNGLKVYLAGKIGSNDWRHKVVPQLRDDDRSWCEKDTLPTCDGNTYVGPFFISCDHSCYHEPNSHGALAGGHCRAQTNYHYTLPTQEAVFNKAVQGIKACDLFFVWAGEDFGTAYGTHVEIGMARALGKRIIIGHDSTGKTDHWFALRCATEEIRALDPVVAYSVAAGRVVSQR